MVNGVDMLWYPVGFTAGYLAMLLYVAAPLRRSGAYTLPDFAEARLRSTGVRALATGFVVLIGWLYLVPQLQGAGLTLTTVTGAPSWVGAVVVGAVVTLNVAVGGMRSITFVQAFQYWVKLTAIAFPAMVLLAVWYHRDGAPGPAQQPLLDDGSRWLVPLTGLGEHPLFIDYSLILATFLGTMGLPHVLVRFYTNPDGRAARTTTLVVLGLLGVFYLFPTVYGALGRVYAPNCCGTATPTRSCWCCRTPRSAGCPASCSAGWSPPVRSPPSCPPPAGCSSRSSGVLSTDVFGRWSGGHGSVRDFRRSAMVAGVGAAAAGAAGRLARTVHCGRSGVRGGGVDVLSAAGAGDLVAAADPDRRRRRADRRRRPVRRRGADHRARHRSCPAGPGRCSPSRPPGACRSSFAVMVLGSLASQKRVPATWAGRWCSCTHRNGSASSGDRAGATVIVVTSAQPARRSAHLPPRDPTAVPKPLLRSRHKLPSTATQEVSRDQQRDRPVQTRAYHPRGVLPDGRRPKIRATCGADSGTSCSR